MVEIVKYKLVDGVRYEIGDIDQYVAELTSRGISPPPAAYHIFVTHDNDALYRTTHGELDDEIALFFQLGGRTNIPYKIREKPGVGQS